MKKRNAWVLALAGIGLVGGASAQPTEWKDWGGDTARMHYSPLT